MTQFGILRDIYPKAVVEGLDKPINMAFVRPDDILVLEKDKDVLFVGLSKLSDIITFKTGIEKRAACHDCLLALQYSLAAL